VGLPLFDRSSQGVQTTEAGAAFVEHARLALSSADLPRSCLHDLWTRAAAIGNGCLRPNLRCCPMSSLRRIWASQD
jgi:DNA-binding transcriptional LysR family regulator